jgi:hypothetical protein
MGSLVILLIIPLAVLVFSLPVLIYILVAAFELISLRLHKGSRIFLSKRKEDPQLETKNENKAQKPAA